MSNKATARQYVLKQRAIALGWPSDRIVTIDSDQGQLGASAADRASYQKLVAEVGLGRAGIVLGLEVSRLARNSADWHRLVELCALANTAIADEDGFYDPPRPRPARPRQSRPERTPAPLRRLRLARQRPRSRPDLQPTAAPPLAKVTLCCKAGARPGPLAICGHCGRRMSVRYQTRKGHHYPTYTSHRHAIEHGTPPCQHTPRQRHRPRHQPPHPHHHHPADPRDRPPRPRRTRRERPRRAATARDARRTRPDFASTQRRASCVFERRHAKTGSTDT